MSGEKDVTTTAGETFTLLESVDMARLVLKRFGNMAEAAEAWRRLLQNTATDADFAELIGYPEHTAHCQGTCRHPDPASHDHKAAERASNVVTGKSLRDLLRRAADTLQEQCDGDMNDPLAMEIREALGE